MRTIFLSLLAIVLALLLTPDSIAATFKLASLSSPPYEYVEQGEVKGIAVDIVKEAFRLMGHQVTIHVYPMRRSLEIVKSGEVDRIFTAFKTPEREKFITYTKEPVLLLTISLWVKNDSNISFDGELSHLSQYRFGAVRGMSYGSKFDEFSKSGLLSVELASDQTNAINMALAKRFDILISNHFGAIHDMKKMGLLNNSKVLHPVLQEQETYFGFAKKAHFEALRDELDEVLKLLKQNGYYDLIMKKYRDIVIPR
ncbi:substrate-binding periplasmic protein [Undibacterium sp. Ji42W]|uniref:substrate-binding periplasmic protein n=1 Tax=Undibacterium sp. Ji42W TaxID=3413039 RepID=UPI003BF32E37